MIPYAKWKTLLALGIARHRLGHAEYQRHAAMYGGGGASGIVKTEGQFYTLGSYGAYAGMWYKWVDENFDEGEDYTCSLTIPASFPNGTIIRWDVPDTPPALAGVYGYLNVQYGNYDASPVEVPVIPVQLKNIGTFTMDATWSFSETKIGDDGSSVLTECWLTAEATPTAAISTSGANVLFEVGFFPHVSTETASFIDSATPIGTFVDSEARSWDVASATNPVGKPFIMAKPSDDQDIAGPYYWKELFDFLIDEAVLTGDEWFNGIAFGVEPYISSGTLTVSNFQVNIELPAEANYITEQDLSNAYWTKDGVTISGTDTVIETAITGQHRIYKTGIARTAGAARYTAYLDFEAAGRSALFLQIFDGTFGHQAIAYFDTSNLDTLFPDALGGAWSDPVAYIERLPNGKYRCRLDFTTDGSTTDFAFIPYLCDALLANSYAGDITKGAKLTNLWLFDQAWSVAEPESPNLLVGGDDFSNAAWTKTGVTVANAGTANQALMETTGGTLHYVRQSITKDAISRDYRLQFDLKVGAGKTWIRAVPQNGTFAGYIVANFNASGPATGTAQTGAPLASTGTYSATDIGGGVIRCIRDWTHDTTTSIHLDIMVGQGDNNVSYAGVDTQGIYIRNVKVFAL